MVGPRDAGGGKNGAHSCSQPALQSIADDGVADLFGHGEAGAQAEIVVARTLGANPDQQQKPGSWCPPPGVGGDEILARGEDGVRPPILNPTDGREW